MQDNDKLDGGWSTHRCQRLVIDSGSLTFATFPDFREISTNLIFLQLVMYLERKTVRQTHNAVILVARVDVPADCICFAQDAPHDISQGMSFIQYGSLHM